MKFTGFTRRIWESFSSTADKRADCLRKLYANAATIGCEGKYLDIGCGGGQNAIVFGQDCPSIHCLDIDVEDITKCQARFRLKSIGNVSFYQGDAQALPFKDATFDSVSMFSVIEHVPKQHLAIQEASRILKPSGQLILQVPNKYFFVDLHTGIPFLHYLPSCIRYWLLTKLGYKELRDALDTEIPSKGELNRLILSEFATIRLVKVVYPRELILPQIRPIYYLLDLLGLFRFIPFGWLFVSAKVADNSQNSIGVGSNMGKVNPHGQLPTNES